MNALTRFRGSVRSLGRAWARFRPYLRGQRTLLAVGTAGMIGEIALRLAEPWPLKFVFDRVLSVRPAKGAGLWIPPAWGPTEILVFAVAVLAGLTALRAGAAYASSIAFALVGNRVLTRVRSDLFLHLQRLSLRYHATARTGDLLTRVIGDVGRLQDVAVTAAVPLVVHVATLLGMLVLMFAINWQLGLLALGVVPAMLVISGRLGGKIRDAARRQRRREGDASSTAAEGLAAIRTVQSLGIEDRIGQVFARSNDGTLAEGVRAARLSAKLERGIDVVIGIVTAAVLWRGTNLALAGEITPGDVIVFLTYLKSAFKPVRDMAKHAARISKASASAERVLEILDTRPEIVDRPGCRPAPERVETLGFEGVDFEYTPGRAALSSLGFTASAGDTIALVGPSGSGKTTIAGLILRLYDPSRGRVLVNGTDVREFETASWRGRVALVPQENTLFGVSVRENLLFGRPGATEAELIAACELVGAWEFVRDLPQGLDTVIGERGETLSGGQRRRLALARAAVREAPVLVLDEPTSGLDHHSKDLVHAAIAQLGRGRLTVVISHDLTLAADADQVLFIEHGRVAERGTHGSLLAAGGRYAAMFALQTAGMGEESDERAVDALPG